MSGIIGDNVGRGSGVTVAPSGGLEAGSKTDFFQASAPTDWTQDTANNDKMLRVVSGSGGGTGGTSATSSPAHSITAAAHTLATSEIPSHDHDLASVYTSSCAGVARSAHCNNGDSASRTHNEGGGGSHTHSTSGSITTPAYMDVIIAAKD